MELLSPELRAELEESMSQTIHVFFELKLKPQLDGASSTASRTRVTDRQLQPRFFSWRPPAATSICARTSSTPFSARYGA